MPAVAIETVIIIIVVVSFAVLAAVIFALYWLWHLLLEDRRCSRNFEREWQRQSIGPLLGDGPQRSLLGSHRMRNPRISRRREVFVDERSRRMVKARSSEGQVPISTSRGQSTETATVISPMTQSSTIVTSQPDVVVLDGTEPPPPYEEATR